MSLRNTLQLSKKLLARPHAQITTPLRKLGSTEAIPAYPIRNSFGITKLVVITAPFIYIGGMISMHGAAFLEDYDIFVPEDDDDD